MIIADLTGRKGAYWNSNLMGKSRAENLLQHGTSESLIKYAKDLLGVDYLYGGWMEDRSYNLKGSYLEPDNFLHLGMDIFTESDSTVRVMFDAKLIQTYNDVPEEAGWGTRLLFKVIDENDSYVVYGHLNNRLLSTMKVGDLFKKGTPIGLLGTREENGGWSPHLHIQCIKGNIDEYLANPVALDGYGKLSEISTLARRFPDPMRFVGF